MAAPGDTRYADRREAGRRLAALLGPLRDDEPLVLALPRGGVPVADEIARALAAPLDLVLVRKIGAPHFEELALAAVVDGEAPRLHVNAELMRRIAPPPGWIEQQMREKLAEIARRRRLYRGERPPPALAGRCVILVDDGIATGATARAALQSLREAGARRLVLAVPVGAPEVLYELESEVDELVCPLRPWDFSAVGAWYRSFAQTSDEEVCALLAAARGRA